MRTESASYIADNLDDILVKIISFTRLCHGIFLDNIRNIHRPDFTPRCLDAEKFTDLMNRALTEHTNHNRLLWSDSRTIRFGRNGDFEIEAIVDEKARELFRSDRDRYLQKQKQWLVENSVNNKIAVELLRQKQRAAQTMN